MHEVGQRRVISTCNHDYRLREGMSKHKPRNHALPGIHSLALHDKCDVAARGGGGGEKGSGGEQRLSLKTHHSNSRASKQRDEEVEEEEGRGTMTER